MATTTSTLNISLPEPLKRYVDSQTEDGQFATPSEYIGELISEDRRRLEAHLMEALKEEDQAIEIPQEVLAHGDIVGFILESVRDRE